jgi:hypothetical protein
MTGMLGEVSGATLKLVNEALAEVADGEHCMRFVLSNRLLRHCSWAERHEGHSRNE